MKNVNIKELITNLKIRTSDDLKGNKRLKNETFEKYQLRRKVEAYIIKHYLKGRKVG